MTEGRHYWEVEITASAGNPLVRIGAVPVSYSDHNNAKQTEAYMMFLNTGCLFGSGKRGYAQQGKTGKVFAQGDCVGVLLDLDAGWMRFYRNGKRCGPGFTEGVKGPLVRAAHLSCEGQMIAALPGAVIPEGAGATDEPWNAISDERHGDDDSSEDDGEDDY
jgi:hypothetical protein